MKSSVAEESAKVDTNVSFLPSDMSMGTANSSRGSIKKLLVKRDGDSSSGANDNEHIFQKPEKSEILVG